MSELAHVLRAHQGPLPHVVFATFLTRLVHVERHVAVFVVHLGHGPLNLCDPKRRVLVASLALLLVSVSVKHLGPEVKAEDAVCRGRRRWVLSRFSRLTPRLPLR